MTMLGVLATRLLSAEMLSWMYFRDQLPRFFFIGAYLTENFAGFILPVSHEHLIVAIVCQSFILSHLVAYLGVQSSESALGISLVGSAITSAVTLPYLATIKSRLVC